MKLGEIIRDSVRYPFFDWKNLLIFGIFVVIASVRDIPVTEIQSNMVVINLISVVVYLFLFGYILWNVKSSLDGNAKLPKVLDLVQIVIGGIKVFLVIIIYSIPVFLLLLLGSMYSASSILLVSLLYPFIIAPIFAISIAHMANNNSEVGFAFKFFEILERLESIGWIKLIMWYLTTVIIFVVLKGIIILISIYINYIVGIVIAVVLTSIFYMYLSRSLALIYKSGINTRNEE
ncbi:MAG: DUF4013 domain-containing protein [Methanobacterium sp. ERen5]|nr:MAG: DUF4013 domain-containing protein [Methanobacterium sp. ERen5]